MAERKSKADTQKGVMAILMGDEPAETANAPQTLPVADLVPFADHPFKLYEGDRLDDMVRSISELGVLMPVIVRPNEDETYEILSGHNRANAAKLAGLTQIPVIIKEGLTDDEARLIVTETNLVQRSFADLSHSERAIALKQHMDAIKKQGKRTVIVDEIENLLKVSDTNGNGTSALLEPKLAAREKTAEKYGLCRANVTRYMRLTNLIRPLLNRVDAEEIGLYPAVSLSYLTEGEQSALNALLNSAAYKVDMKKADALRDCSERKQLTDESMEQILSGEINKKPKSKTAPPLKIKPKLYQKYFDIDTPQAEIETVIDKALAEYFKNHKEAG